MVKCLYLNTREKQNGQFIKVNYFKLLPALTELYMISYV